MVGARFGRLTVLEKAPKTPGSHDAFWRCLCDCGNEIVVRQYKLRTGRTQSCGCYRKDFLRSLKTTHGETGGRLHGVWNTMIQRCTNPNVEKYPVYGGRGIAVCKEWRDNYEAFRDWALDNGYAPGLTLDRKDTDGDYCPENCRWATQEEQQNNKRNNRKITAFGQTLTIQQWSKKIGIKDATIRYRLSHGWSVEDALKKEVGAVHGGRKRNYPSR